MLEKLLEKLGVSSYDELNQEEKETYLKMSEALKREITVEDVKRFLEGEIERLEFTLLDYGNGKDKDMFLKARIRNYKMLLAFIISPEMAKENVKDMIKGLWAKNKGKF